MRYETIIECKQGNWKEIFEEAPLQQSLLIWCWITHPNNQRNRITGMWWPTWISACPYGQGCYLLVMPLCPILWWETVLSILHQSIDLHLIIWARCPLQQSLLIWCWIALPNNQRNGITGMWRPTQISVCPYGQGCYLLVVPLCPILWWETVISILHQSIDLH